MRGYSDASSFLMESGLSGIPFEVGRRNHYSSFYAAHGDSGSAVVIGNCQAESLRIVLEGSDLPTVRIPPVHELTAADMPYLDRLLASAPLVVSQPIHDDYHGLPVGTRQVRERLAATARLVVVPAIRHRALHPAHVVVRHPDGDVEAPPIVDYHDLRTIAEALGRPRPRLDRDLILGIAESSTAELSAREQRSDAVPISDLFASPRFELLRTLNHPGNPVWFELALRVRERAGLAPVVTDPGRELLSSVVAPREQVVIDTWGTDDVADPSWRLGDERVPDDDVREAHLRWYAENPSLLRFAAERHADALAALVGA
jgi:hypothetical protein